MKLIKSLILITALSNVLAHAMKPEAITLTECMRLPINTQGPLHATLEAQIPTTFKQARSINVPNMVEWRDFIPASCPNTITWDEMITTQTHYRNQPGINAKSFLNQVRDSIIQKAGNPKIVTEAIKVYPTHLEAILCLLYNEERRNNHRELLWAQFFSDNNISNSDNNISNNVVCIQYTLVIPENDDSRVPQLLKKVQTFLKDNTRIILTAAPGKEIEIAKSHPHALNNNNIYPCIYCKAIKSEK